MFTGLASLPWASVSVLLEASTTMFSGKLRSSPLLEAASSNEAWDSTAVSASARTSVSKPDVTGLSGWKIRTSPRRSAGGKSAPNSTSGVLSPSFSTLFRSLFRSPFWPSLWLLFWSPRHCECWPSTASRAEALSTSTASMKSGIRSK